ncbi:copper/silver efflux system [Bacteroidales bacterium]|nr:copper/silver efflux system [Bacteroidales bacterium]
MNNFIDSIIAFSLKNKFFIFFCTLLIILAGVVSIRETPIDAFPDITNTKVSIITQWQGRSAEEVEKFITIPIEVVMNSVQKKTDIRSTSLFGLSVINIMFEDGVEGDFARQQIFNLLQDAELPDGISPEVQPLYGPTGEIFRYTLRSSSKTVRELKTIQDWLIDRNMRSVSGVADIVSFGGEVRSFEVSVNPNDLLNYNIQPLELYEAIAKSNINVGGDVIVKSSQAYVVRGIGLINNIQELENVVVTNIDGTPILVKHLADVIESSLPRLGQVGRMEEDDVVQGIVVMRKDENPGLVIAELKSKIADLNDHILPKDVEIVAFYDREDLVELAVETVSKNLMEGILLVVFIVLIFMADWRTTVVVTVVIPLSLLFAFICLHLKGMSANLLSLGAIDFGIIIDGSVVMVEGIFVALDKQAHKVGMQRFNKMSKLGIIRKTGKEMGKPIFFSKLIIITALIPIFAFEKVEGKMFSPLAYTLGFALLGALLFTLTLVPVLSSMLLKKNVREKSNFFLRFITSRSISFFDVCYRYKKISLLTASAIVIAGLSSFYFLGSEFLPQLNEGSIYIRATLPQSIALNESVALANVMRKELSEFEEVKQVLSQTGRPNDGTDPTGFYNIEFHVDIYPQKQWESKLTKEELIEKMNAKLSAFPGVDFNFSQPITDNVEEAASGVKGSIAVKIYGSDLYLTEKKAEEVYEILKTVDGIEDLGLIRNIGQPELRIEFIEDRLALYGVGKEEAQSIIEMAIGGKIASNLYEDERKFDIVVRYQEEFRKNEEEIGKIMVPTMSGNYVQIKELANIYTITGPLIIFRDNHTRFCAVKFSIRGRDMGSAIAEAQEKVNKALVLPSSYTMKWTGDFENQQRASKRLQHVVPISILLIFMILFTLFGNARDAGLVLINVPFACIGGIFALLITGTNFSISAGIGFIALFGICIQNGVIMISVIKSNLREGHSLPQSLREGVQSRVRPIVMTAMMAAIGLMPAALSTGIGSEAQKPLAIVIIGGLVTATIFILFIFPLIIESSYSRSLFNDGELNRRKLAK